MSKVHSVLPLSLIALLSLTACGNADDSGNKDSDTAPDDSGDTGVDPHMDIVVSSTFLGTDEISDVFVNGDWAGVTGDIISMLLGDEVSIGSVDSSSEGGRPDELSQDGIPVHSLSESWDTLNDGTWSGGDTISPSRTVTEGLTFLAFPLNVYTSGWWTCFGSVAPDHPIIDEADYTKGNQVLIPGTDVLMTNGDQLTYDTYYFGEFTSPNTATVYYQASATDLQTFTCFASDAEGNAR